MRTINKIGTVFCTDCLRTVTVDKVKDALNRSGLDPEMARELSKRYCFSRAKNCLHTEGLIEEVLENDQKWIFQLSTRYREQMRLSYEFDSQFWFNKETETIGADNDTLLNQVNILFKKYGENYLPNDLSTLIRRVFDKQKGILPLRHHGVVYFVPSEAQTLMDKVAEFVQVLGADCLSFPIGAENKQIKDKAESMLIERVKADLATITEEMKQIREKGDSLTNRKASGRWRQLLAQLERVKLFAKSLQVDTGTLMSKVRVAELDLALITNDNMDVIAALAHAGKMNNTLGEIAKNAFKGELPTIGSPRVKQFEEMMVEVGKIELPNIKNTMKAEETVEVS